MGFMMQLLRFWVGPRRGQEGKLSSSTVKSLPTPRPSSLQSGAEHCSSVLYRRVQTMPHCNSAVQKFYSAHVSQQRSSWLIAITSRGATVVEQASHLIVFCGWSQQERHVTVGRVSTRRSRDARRFVAPGTTWQYACE
jgi:hypothetical protein